MTLTRRDRAALTLALECVRLSFGCVWHTNAHSVRAKHAVSWATGTLSVASGHGRAPVLDDLFEALDDEEVSRVPARLLRARLALLLRAVLRADRGDYGPWHSPVRDQWYRAHVTLEAMGYSAAEAAAMMRTLVARGGFGQTRRITPLWSRAPETRR